VVGPFVDRLGRGLIFTMLWTAPAPGSALRQAVLDAPQWVVAIPYVVVGWCPIIVAPQLCAASAGPASA